ncbi:MAG: DUF3575 domain-containing protein [Flavobacteriaceae bacterium]
MKNYKLLILLFLMSSVAFSQEAEKENMFKNEISMDIIDLIDGTFQFSYERALGEHFSVNFGIGLKTEEGLIQISGIDRPRLKTGDITYNGFKFIPEVRYYINKTRSNRLDGFYFGAYVKHNAFQSDLAGIYTDSQDIDYDFLFDTKLRITSFGFMVGYKLPIGKRFTIDFLIAGPGVVWHKYTMKNKEDLPDEFYDDLNEALENYFGSIDLEFRLSKINEIVDFVLPAMRYGVSLGYSF